MSCRFERNRCEKTLCYPYLWSCRQQRGHHDFGVLPTRWLSWRLRGANVRHTQLPVAGLWTDGS